MCGAIETKRYAYDDHGQIAAMLRNGVDTTAYARGPWGRSVRVSARGRAPSDAIFDLNGVALWTRDSAGSEQVRLEDVAAQVRALLTFRRPRHQNN